MGLAHAQQHEFDWTWILDADSVPEPEALATLLASFRRLPPSEQVVNTGVVRRDVTAPGVVYHAWRLGPLAIRLLEASPIRCYYNVRNMLSFLAILMPATSAALGWPKHRSWLGVSENLRRPVEANRHRATIPLNQFIERNVIELWCERLGYEREAYISAEATPWGDTAPLGQSAVILRANLNAIIKDANAQDSSPHGCETAFQCKPK